MGLGQVMIDKMQHGSFAPIDSVQMFFDGKEHKVRIAPQLKCLPFERALSGKRGIMIMLDTNPTAGKETLWAKELTFGQVREMAAALVAMADELEKSKSE